MEKIVAAALGPQLANFIKDYDPSKIDTSFFSGKGYLTNLNINEEFIGDLMALPQLVVKRVFINKLQAKLSLTKLRTDPVVLIADTVEIVLEEPIDVLPPKPKKKKKNGTVSYGLSKQIVDGIRFEVNKVQIFIRTLGTLEFGPGYVSPPTMQIDLVNFSIYTTNSEWKIVDLSKALPTFRKGIKSMCVFKEGKAQSISMTLLPMYSAGGSSKPIPLIKDIPFLMHITMKKKILRQAATSARVDLLIDHLSMSLNKTQTNTLIHALWALMNCMSRKPPKVDEIGMPPSSGLSSASSSSLPSPDYNSSLNSSRHSRSQSSDVGINFNPNSNSSVRDGEESDEEVEEDESELMDDYFPGGGKTLIPELPKAVSQSLKDAKIVTTVRINDFLMNFITSEPPPPAPPPVDPKQQQQQSRQEPQLQPQPSFCFEAHGLQISQVKLKTEASKEASLQIVIPWFAIKYLSSDPQDSQNPLHTLLGPADSKGKGVQGVPLSSSSFSAAAAKMKQSFPFEQMVADALAGAEVLSSPAANIAKKLEALQHMMSTIQQNVFSSPVATKARPSAIAFMDEIMPNVFPAFHHFSLANPANPMEMEGEQEHDSGQRNGNDDDDDYIVVSSSNASSSADPFSSSNSSNSSSSSNSSKPDLLRLKYTKLPESKQIEARLQNALVVTDFARWGEFVTFIAESWPEAVAFAERQRKEAKEREPEDPNKPRKDYSLFIEMIRPSFLLLPTAPSGRPGISEVLRAHARRLVIGSDPKLERSRCCEDGDMIFSIPPPRFLSDSSDFRRLHEAWASISSKYQAIVQEFQVDIFRSPASPALNIVSPLSIISELAMDKKTLNHNQPRIISLVKAEELHIQLSQYQAVLLLEFLRSYADVPPLSFFPTTKDKKKDPSEGPSEAENALIKRKKKLPLSLHFLFRIDRIVVALQNSRAFDELITDSTPLQLELCGMEAGLELNPFTNRSVTKFRLRHLDVSSPSLGVPAATFLTSSQSFNARYSSSTNRMSKMASVFEIRFERPWTPSSPLPASLIRDKNASSAASQSASGTSTARGIPRSRSDMTIAARASAANSVQAALDESIFASPPLTARGLEQPGSSSASSLVKDKAGVAPASQLPSALLSSVSSSASLLSSSSIITARSAAARLVGVLNGLHVGISGTAVSQALAFFVKRDNLMSCSVLESFRIYKNSKKAAKLRKPSKEKPAKQAVPSIFEIDATGSDLQFMLLDGSVSPQGLCFSIPSASVIRHLDRDTLKYDASFSLSSGPGLFFVSFSQDLISKTQVLALNKAQCKILGEVQGNAVIKDLTVDLQPGPLHLVPSQYGKLREIFLTHRKDLSEFTVMFKAVKGLMTSMDISQSADDPSTEQELFAIQSISGKVEAAIDVLRSNLQSIVQEFENQVEQLSSPLPDGLQNRSGGKASGAAGASFNTPGTPGEAAFETEGFIEIAEHWFPNAKLRWKRSYAAIQDDYLIAFKKKKELKEGSSGPRYVVHLPTCIVSVINPLAKSSSALGLKTLYAIELARGAHGHMLLCFDTDAEKLFWFDKLSSLAVNASSVSSSSVSARARASSVIARNLAYSSASSSKKSLSRDQVELVTPKATKLREDNKPAASSAAEHDSEAEDQNAEEDARLSATKSAYRSAKSEMEDLITQGERMKDLAQLARVRQTRLTSAVIKYRDFFEQTRDDDAKKVAELQLLMATAQHDADERRKASASDDDSSVLRIQVLEECIAQMSADMAVLNKHKMDMDELKSANSHYKTVTSQLMQQISDRDEELNRLLEERRRAFEKNEQLETQIARLLIADSRLQSFSSKIKTFTGADAVTFTELQHRLVYEVEQHNKLREHLDKLKETHAQELKSSRSEVLLLAGELSDLRSKLSSLLNSGISAKSPKK